MADRTVSVRLRAEIGDFVAEFNLAGKAVDDFGKKVDGTSRKVTDSGKKTEESVKKTTESVRRSSASTGTWIASLVGAAAGMSAPFVAAGGAAVAFGAVAAPSIAKVVAAQKDLTLQWVTLDARQKATSAHMNAVIDQYQQLAKAYEPQALSTFNSLLGDTSVLMQRAKPLLDAGAQGISNLTGHIDSFVTGGNMTRFLNFAATQAGPTFDKLGTTFDQTGTLALHLVEDLAPMGQTLLTAANGGLRLLNAVEQINPHLAEAAATTLALRAPTQALADLWDSGATKVGKWANKTAEADGKLAKLAKGALSADSTLGKLGRTISSSPNLYIGAALALGYVTARLVTAKDTTDNLVDSIRTENRAIGNNVQGHLAAAASFDRYIRQTKAAQQAFQARYAAENRQGQITADQYREAQGAVAQYGAKIAKLSQARKDELTAAKNVTAGENDLMQTYNLGRDAANQFATAAGVDLSKGITGAGDAAKAAQAKLRAYFEAVQQAQDPTWQVSQALSQAGNNALDLKTRMTALTNAFSALAGPELQAYDATTKTAQAFDAFDAAMKKSKGSMSLTTAAGQNARTAFAGLLSMVEQNIDAQYQYDSATKGAAVAERNRADSARKMLPVLLAEVGNNKAAANAVLDWATAAGVGKTRAEAMAATVGGSKAAFLAAAEGAGKSRDEALKLWAAYNRLPAVKTTKLNNNAPAAAQSVRDYQAWLDRLHGKTVIVHTVYTSSGSVTFGAGNRRLGNWRGGLIHRADGGPLRGFADGGPSGYVRGPGTTTSDSIVVALSDKEYVVNAKQTAKYRPLLDAINYGMHGFADGGIVGYASGGTVGDVSLSSILSDWTTAVKPSTKAQVDAALKSRRTQLNQLAAAEDALARARKRGNARDIAAAERRIAQERRDVADATSKLADVEARYKFTKQKPATQLGSALTMDIKAKAAFIRNLTTLTDRGFGPLAQQLLAMGDSQAEKIAADAVKLSNAKLSKLNSQIGQEQQQATQLANLPAFLTARAAIKAGKGSSWVGLLNATGLTPDVLALAVRSMLTDLNKTTAGRALVADMHAHGYAQGGEVAGRPGVDANWIRATRGEFVVREGPARRYRPWVDAINRDQLGAFVRHLVSGGSGGYRPAAAAGAPAAGPTINQTFPTQEMNTAELARAAAREAAWALG